MSKATSPLLSKMNQLINEKKKVDEDIQYLDIVILYWDDFIKKIKQLKIDDVPPVWFWIQMGHPDYIKPIWQTFKLPKDCTWIQDGKGKPTSVKCKINNKELNASETKQYLLKVLPDSNLWGGHILPNRIAKTILLDNYDYGSYVIKRDSNTYFLTKNYYSSVDNKLYDAPPRKRLIENFNRIAFDLQMKIKDLKKTDNPVNFKAAVKLQRMLNNFTGSDTSNKKSVKTRFLVNNFGQKLPLPGEYRIPVNFMPLNINVDAFPKTVVHNVFYNENRQHVGIDKVIETMYNAFPETNIKDIDAVKVEKEKKSNQLYEEIIKIQSMITLQGGTFNLDTPPNVSDAGKAAQQTNQAAEPFVITPLQKIMIGTAILLLISSIGIAALNPNKN